MPQNNYLVSDQQDEDNGKTCDGQEHALTKKFKCDQTNCMAIICRKCMGCYGNSGQRYCVLCALSIKIDEEPDEWVDLADEANNVKVIGNFHSTISVKADKETG